MSHKTSPARRAAFFRALRETGNQTLACERARVSRSWMSLQRASDPQFRAEMEAAVAEAKERLRWVHCQGANLPRRSAAMSGGQGDPDNQVRGDGSCRPPRKWAFQDGEELVVRGSQGPFDGAQDRRRIQIARARLHQWTPRVEARFLALVEQTCNLRLALKEVRLSAQSLHEHRKRWPAFDAACEEALEAGYRNLDTGLAHAACALFHPDHYPLPEPPLVAPMTVDGAISLMRLHEKRRWEGERGIGPCGRVWRWRQSGVR